MQNTEIKNKFIARTITQDEFFEGKDTPLYEQQAREGYMLVNYNGVRYEFAPCEPEDVEFYVELTDFYKYDFPGSPFDLLREVYSSGGWEYVTSYDLAHIFKAPRGTPPVYVGAEREHEAERYDNLAYKDMRQSHVQILLAVISVIICALCGLVLFSESPLRTVAIPGALSFGGMAVTTVICAFLYRRRAKEYTRNAENLRNGELVLPKKSGNRPPFNKVIPIIGYFLMFNLFVVVMATRKVEIHVARLLIIDGIAAGLLILYYLLSPARRKDFALLGMGIVSIFCFVEPMLLIVKEFEKGYKLFNIGSVIGWVFIWLMNIYNIYYTARRVRDRIREHREKSKP
jgi:hypothetical protein